MKDAITITEYLMKELDLKDTPEDGIELQQLLTPNLISIVEYNEPLFPDSINAEVDTDN